MRKSIYLLLIVLAGCSSPNKNSSNNNSVPAKDTVIPEIKKESSSPKHFLTIEDAEKVMGEPVVLAESNSSHDGIKLTYLCGYKAVNKDKATGKTGALYFLLEEYNEEAEAKERYSFIKTINQKNGIKTLEGIGDEAYFHTDNENFYFIMVRKGKNVFNMKVNKLTSTTSLDAFNSVSKKITEAI